ncbi:MAG: hypothetical protein COU27_01660 [Candidatus Levybacteria bacterium CG10_big_fil_rev_8_21_14_0_10_36_7]|nr:MAG: hypothetical protein COU27_01660 [Candidatus Levybacteria bacterium CG10_big_fil_rev_8_21_14_0_10_36_7]
MKEVISDLKSAFLKTTLFFALLHILAIFTKMIFLGTFSFLNIFLILDVENVLGERFVLSPQGQLLSTAIIVVVFASFFFIKKGRRRR